MQLKVAATYHDAGVTLDFPLPEDLRDAGRRRAWRLYEIGTFLLLGSVLWISFCYAMEWFGVVPLATLPFVVGILLLIMAANRSGASWSDDHYDRDLRQLAFAGNLLVRTFRDHQKEVWYRHEIRSISVVAPAVTDAATSVAGRGAQLVMQLQNAEPVILWELGSAHASTDRERNTELEWIATVLREALARGLPEATDAAHAIQDLGARMTDTRIASESD